jgi:hypothetical protein
MKPHNINLDEFDNIFEWLFENECEMHAAIYDRLEYAFENNKKKVALFRFEGTDSVLTINLNKTGIYLDKALRYFEHVEEYEKCSSILRWKKIINTLNIQQHEH